MRLRLEFEVDYDPAGVSQEDLADKLANIAHRALDEGLLTGDTAAEVSSEHICVRDLDTGELV